jgi:hypothetical protein
MTNVEISAIKSLMIDFNQDWAICGGWAIDLFLGRQTREHSHEPNFIEVLLNESDETHFLFRRDKSICHLKGELIHFSEEGIPYLAPEIVLLYKSKKLDKNNQHDFEVCASELGDGQKEWLKSGLEKLYGEHA